MYPLVGTRRKKVLGIYFPESDERYSALEMGPDVVALREKIGVLLPPKLSENAGRQRQEASKGADVKPFAR